VLGQTRFVSIHTVDQTIDLIAKVSTTQVLKVLDLEWEAQTAATLAELGKPFGESHRRGLCDSGLRWAFHYADWCLGWIWRQWLMGTAHEAIQVVVTTAGYRIRHMWCWSHCGMAMLAHRKGIEIATDPLWFPLNALGGCPVNQLK